MYARPICFEHLPMLSKLSYMSIYVIKMHTIDEKCYQSFMLLYAQCFSLHMCELCYILVLKYVLVYLPYSIYKGFCWKKKKKKKKKYCAKAPIWLSTLSVCAHPQHRKKKKKKKKKKKSLTIANNRYFIVVILCSVSHCAKKKKPTIHQATTMLATSENLLISRPDLSRSANHWYWWPDTLIIARAPAVCDH